MKVLFCFINEVAINLIVILIEFWPFVLNFIFQNNYNEKFSEILKTKDFFSRKELKDIHSEKKDNAIEIFNANKKTIKTERTIEFSNALINILETSYNTFYNENEQKRETIINEAIKKWSMSYIQNMTERLNQYCMESSSFDDFSSQLKSNALKQLKVICYKETELYSNYFKKVCNKSNALIKYINYLMDIKYAYMKYTVYDFEIYSHFLLIIT